jgi:uncharacterized protein YecE (DUF72 family)
MARRAAGAEKESSPRDDGPGADPAHDPGVAAAAERAALAASASAAPIRPRAGGDIRLGTAGWTDPTLVAKGVFYPADASEPEDRLKYYASRFSTVEVDSPYYALPARRNAELWAARTPPGFVFDVKAYAPMTGHPTEIARLPKTLRAALPREVAEKRRVYPKALPAEVYDEIWRLFRDAVEPLADAGKLGAILLQYPRWFVPNAESRDAILEARDRLGGLPFAVEFRHHFWFSPKGADRTLAFLRDHAIPFVMVDEPQGLASSVPPIAAVTSPALAIVRMHGRRADMWERPGATVAEKYRYLYDREELGAWVPKVLEAASEARETRVVFNNCYANYGTTNALEMGMLIASATG